MAISILKKKREARELEEIEYLKRLFLNLDFFKEIQSELEPDAFHEVFCYLRHESFAKYRPVFNVGMCDRFYSQFTRLFLKNFYLLFR
jgi:hypothetical protein